MKRATQTVRSDKQKASKDESASSQMYKKSILSQGLAKRTIRLSRHDNNQAYFLVELEIYPSASFGYFHCPLKVDIIRWKESASFRDVGFLASQGRTLRNYGNYDAAWF